MSKKKTIKAIVKFFTLTTSATSRLVVNGKVMRPKEAVYYLNKANDKFRVLYYTIDDDSVVRISKESAKVLESLMGSE